MRLPSFLGRRARRSSDSSRRGLRRKLEVETLERRELLSATSPAFLVETAPSDPRTSSVAATGDDFSEFASIADLAAGSLDVAADSDRDLFNTQSAAPLDLDQPQNEWIVDGNSTLGTANDGNEQPPLLGPALSVTVDLKASGVVGEEISFVADVRLTGAGTPDDRYFFVWDFGDRTFTRDEAPTHVYTAPGEYTVWLLVVDGVGRMGVTRGELLIVPNADYEGGEPGNETEPEDPESCPECITNPDGNELELPPEIENFEPEPDLPPENEPSAPAPAGSPVIAYSSVPDFGASTTIVSIASGSWSDPNIWSLGRLPRNGDVVTIGEGTAVVYDVLSNARLESLVIAAGGRLQFETTISTRLRVTNFLVLEGGELEIGTEYNPVADDVRAEIIFNNQPLNLDLDPEQWGNGLIVLGKVTIHGSPKSSTFVRLAAEALAGDTVLYLSEPVSGWAIGDQILLPDSHQLDWFEQALYRQDYVPQWEQLTIAGISEDGLTIYLSSPLQFHHKGARNADGELEFLPHVANLTRNVVLRSESPTGVRGHTVFMNRAEVDIRYAQFQGLGRTTNAAFDDTRWDGDVVTYIGTNQSGRYSVNFRDLLGPYQTPEHGYQFVFLGNSVFCPLDPMTFRWGIALKNSHYGLISQNVIYNWAGAGLAVEQGNESFNVISNNFVMRVTGTGDRDTQGREGNGYWFRGPNNYVVDNVATNAYGGTYSYGFVIDARYVGYGWYPAYPGADELVAAHFNGTPLLEFARNEVYGATPGGLALWWIGAQFWDPLSDAGVVKDFRAWHIYSWGYFGYETNNLVIDGFVVRGDVSLHPNNRTVAGMWFGDYIQRGLYITNADIQGTRVGIETPYLADGATVIENSYLRAHHGIVVGTMWSVSGGAHLPPKQTIINNVVFDGVAGVPFTAIALWFDAGDGRNIIQSDTVYVYNFNQVEGDNFQLFYYEQAPDFVVPESGSNPNPINPVTGAPEAGLTNEELWALYGLAVAGEIAWYGETRDGLYGLLLPM